MATITSDEQDVRQADPEPQAQCGRMSFALWKRGIDHQPCDRLEGHDGFCCFEAV